MRIDSPEVSHFFYHSKPLNCHKSAANWVFLDTNGRIVFHEDR